MDDIFADGNDEYREKPRRLTPEQRGQLIMDQVTPRRYSWLKNPDSVSYLHEHEVGDAPPGSFMPEAPRTMAAQTTAYRTPLWYLQGADDDD